MAGGNQRRDRSEEVIAAAVEIFHRKGYPGSSIQDVADQVGVLKGSLYHYIDSKEDLLARIFEESDAQSREIIERVRELDVSAAERLRAFAEQWSLWYMQNVERTSVYFNEWKHLGGERHKQAVKQRQAYEDYVRGLIEEVKQEGAAPSDLDTRYASFFILSAINGLPIWYRRRGRDSAKRIAEIYADMALAVVQGGV